MAAIWASTSGIGRPARRNSADSAEISSRCEVKGPQPKVLQDALKVCGVLRDASAVEHHVPKLPHSRQCHTILRLIWGPHSGQHVDVVL